MNVRTLCLAILNIQDATGYEIKKLSTDGEFQHFVEVSYGSIYPALSKLEKDGMVSSHIATQDGKPNRKIYAITPEGRSELVNLINVLPKPDKFKSEFLLLSLNADIANRALLEQAINGQLAQYTKEMEMLDNLLGDCDQPAMVWAANYGRTVIETKIKYLSDNKDQLLELAPKHPTARAAE
ncbi:MAG: PadR family transcriptional regulator [Hyphomicrobiales bacterium]|nr:PadR family transcriptional regulator [Hyphomicrobiales bacterium]